MIPALIAAFLASLGFLFSGHGGHQRGQQNNQANNPPTDQPTNKPPTSVPTPALLPGLIGLGVATLRKRKAEKDEASV